MQEPQEESFKIASLKEDEKCRKGKFDFWPRFPSILIPKRSFVTNENSINADNDVSICPLAI
jgi:hypothetical protein